MAVKTQQQTTPNLGPAQHLEMNYSSTAPETKSLIQGILKTFDSIHQRNAERLEKIQAARQTMSATKKTN